ncbi:MAG: exo-alpha-sialidase [Planctomycetaceae bacterium]|nr:exo-alpha-sialidase [Planctomycetaceae bacterium]
MYKEKKYGQVIAKRVVLPKSWVLRLVIVCLVPVGTAFSADKELWLDSRCKPMPTQMQGPFVRLDGDAVLSIDNLSSYLSLDGGQSWSKPRAFFDKFQNIKVSNERAMLRTQNGTIIVAFMNVKEQKWTWKNELHDAPGAKLPTYVMRSLDDGKSWQDIQKLHDDYTGAIRDIIQTKDGRVVFTAMKMQHNPGRHAVLTYSSINVGESWKPSGLIDLGGQGHHGGVTEPSLTELKDGRLWMLIRTNWGEFWSAYSRDGGKFWNILQPSGIKASCAPCLIKRLESGRLLLLWNRPQPEGKTDWPLTGGDGLWSEVPVSNHRNELSLAISDDEGKTWTKPAVIARQAGTWLAYPFAFEQQPGVLWVTTMQGKVRMIIKEEDFLKKP